LETKNISLLCSLDSVDTDQSLEHENENNFTEQKFYNSVLEWKQWKTKATDYDYNIIYEQGKYFLKLGEDIGESSSDIRSLADDNVQSVMESIKNFETLLKYPEFRKHETRKKYQYEGKEFSDQSNKHFQLEFPSVKLLATKFQMC